MNTPKITVVTVCYNAVRDIEKTILSVINQTYENIEYIIIDGASTDGTVDVIKKYEDRITKWISEPDKGIYDAMNKGIKMATGEWINFMNAGDCFHDENVLSAVSEKLDPSTDIVYGSINKFLCDCYYKFNPYPLEQMSYHMILPHPGSFIKATYHKKHPFDLSFKSSGDYKFFYDSYYRYGARFKEIDVIVADFDDEAGMSKGNFRRVRLEDLRIWGKEHDLATLIKTYCWFAYRDLKNIIKIFVSENTRRTIRNKQLESQGFKLIKY